MSSLAKCLNFSTTAKFNVTPEAGETAGLHGQEVLSPQCSPMTEAQTVPFLLQLVNLKWWASKYQTYIINLSFMNLLNHREVTPMILLHYYRKTYFCYLFLPHLDGSWVCLHSLNLVPFTRLIILPPFRKYSFPLSLDNFFLLNIPEQTWIYPVHHEGYGCNIPSQHPKLLSMNHPHHWPPKC